MSRIARSHNRFQHFFDDDDDQYHQRRNIVVHKVCNQSTARAVYLFASRVLVVCLLLDFIHKFLIASI